MRVRNATEHMCPRGSRQSVTSAGILGRAISKFVRPIQPRRRSCDLAERTANRRANSTVSSMRSFTSSSPPPRPRLQTRRAHGGLRSKPMGRTEWRRNDFVSASAKWDHGQIPFSILPKLAHRSADSSAVAAVVRNLSGRIATLTAINFCQECSFQEWPVSAAGDASCGALTDVG